MALNPSQKRYPQELRERAVRMVHEAVDENNGDRFGVVSRVARQLGVGVESLRNWVLKGTQTTNRRHGQCVRTIGPLSHGRFGSCSSVSCICCCAVWSD